jgi:rubrerythrin
MSLINCPECGGKISDKADACPNCGLPSNYFAVDSKRNQKQEQQAEYNTQRLLGTFNGKNVYQDGRCPRCDIGTIRWDGHIIRCTNVNCSWSQEQINKIAEESKPPSPGLCPVCGSGKLVILSMAPYIVRCSNPKCLNH